MFGYVKDIDWVNIEAMKYWSFPANYKNDKLQEAKNLVFSGNYIGALKVDGYYERCGKDDEGNMFMIARSKNVNGEAVNKIDWVPQLKDFLSTQPNGTVFLCECYLPDNEGSQKITSLLGCLKDKCIERQEKTQKLNFYIFDVMAYNGENFYNSPIIDRISYLYKIAEKSYPFIQFARYYSGVELWEKLQEYLANNREGIVISKKDAIVYNKRTPARVTLKIKRELRETIDCFFTGKYSAPTKEYTGKELEKWPYWYNEISGTPIEVQETREVIKLGYYTPVTKPYFNGWAGSLEIGVMKDGDVCPIGWLSGLTDEIKANPEKYKGRCIEVGAMQFTPDGNLRHAKMLGFRDDLTYQDCTWEKFHN